MAPNGKKKADAAPSFEEVEAKRVEMVKSLAAVADAFEAATTSVRAYLGLAPHALTEPAASADGSKKRKAAKEKKAKDPNAPKRPVTGYLAYSMDQMPKLKEANPAMPHKVLVGLIGEKWANLPEDEKKVYNDNFSAAMAEWKGKTAEYNQTHENGAASASTEAKPAAGKPAAADAETADEAGSDDESASTASTDSSDSSDTEEEDAKPQEADESDDEEEEEEVPQPPAKKAKRDAPAATPSKSQQKPKSSSAAAVPTSSAKKAASTPAAATPSAETSKKDKKSKKTEAAPPPSEETPAKKRGRKPKAQ